MKDYCEECGFFLWSTASREAGVHPECAGEEEPADATDLEARLEAVWSEEYEQITEG